MPTKTINDLTNTPDILDGDELAFWNLANSRTDKISYLDLKADLLGTASNTEILFMDGTNIAGDSRVTYNNSTNVFSLQASMVGATIDDFTNTVHADGIHKQIRNESGGGLVKGDLVHASGFSIGQDLVLVKKADATSTATMPVMGVVVETIANNATGGAIESGRISGVDTSAFSVGDILFATTTPGVFGIRPTNSTDIVQSIGIVLRSHATMGEIEVEGAGSINTPPNLLDAAMWIGDASNFPVPRIISGDITISNAGVADISSGVVGDPEIGIHTSTKITITNKSQLNSAIVYTDQVNTYGAFAQIFPSGQLQLNNLADDFQYIFTGSAILADRAVTIPLLGAADIFVMEGFAATLANKTLTSPVINTQISGDITTGGNITTTNYLVGATATQTLTNKSFDSITVTTQGDNTKGYLFSDGDGFFQQNSNTIQVFIDGFTRYNLTNVGFLGNNASAFSLRNVASNATTASINPNRTDTTAGLGGLSGSPAMITSNVSRMIWSDTLITSTVDLNIVDTTDTTFSTSKVLTRDAGGVINTIVASGGGTTNFLSADGTWIAPPGGVLISGTPVNNQISIWTSATTIEGDADFTYNADGAFRSFLVTNPNTGAGETMRQVIEVDGTDASSDAYIAFNIGANGATQSYSLGVDNGVSDSFVINQTTGGTAAPSELNKIMAITTLLAGTTASNAIVWSPHMRGGTGNEVGFSIEPIVNKLTSGTYTAFKIDVTETDVNAGNLLMDIGAGGGSQFTVNPSGDVVANTIIIPQDGTAADPALQIGTEGDGFFSLNSNEINLSLNNTTEVFFTPTLTTFNNAIWINTNGTAASPALQIGTDQDGIYRSNTNELSVSINNLAKISFGVSDLFFADAYNMNFKTTTGTKIATATTQKIGFWNVTPVVQPSHIVDADGSLADITTKFNTLLAQMATTGLQASS